MRGERASISLIKRWFMVDNRFASIGHTSFCHFCVFPAWPRHAKNKKNWKKITLSSKQSLYSFTQAHVWVFQRFEFYYFFNSKKNGFHSESLGRKTARMWNDIRVFGSPENLNASASTPFAYIHTALSKESGALVSCNW